MAPPPVAPPVAVTALYPGMAGASEVGQLDLLYVGLTLLTLWHAARRRGSLASGAAVVAFLCVHTALFEHLSLFLGGTHCHASSSVLPMLTPCSSINSVLFYIPWTYTSIEGARRLRLHPAAMPFAVGLLVFGFGAVYEMQGPSNGFWHWPDSDGQIANAPPVLNSWNGYPPVLHEAKALREVATIENGVFRVSRHAAGALAERLHGFPLFAPYFHFAWGWAWGLGLLLSGGLEARAPPSLPRLVGASCLVVVLFLPPIWVTRLVSEIAGVSLQVAVPASLAFSALIVVLSGRRSAATLHTAPSRPDLLLFLISLIMHVFFVSLRWRTPPPIIENNGLEYLVSGTAALHLCAQYICCFQAGGGVQKKDD